MIWINKMVNKRVEKRIADLRSELLLLHYTMRVEMAEELQDQLRELVVEEERERSLLYGRVKREQRVTSRWRRKMEQEYKEKKEKDEADSPDLQTLSFNFCQTSSDTDSICIMRKNYVGESLRIPLGVPSDGDSHNSDTSDGGTTDVSYDADTSSQTAKCDQEENQQVLSDVAVATTSQLKESAEKEKSRTPFHVNLSFMTEELRREDQRVQVGRTKEEEALLMDRQWKEWLDKQEIRGNHTKLKPVEQQITEKLGEAAPPPVPQIEKKLNMTEVDTMTKFKMYIFDLFNSHKFHKWERLEDED
ncbi:uncharacterized protein LOC131975343 isoform X2 [Centropristis striata]|nr:uncharacterized protein LOC131975343 isoform X2 [Centropristis striata]